MHILTALTYYRPHYSGLTIYAEREAKALAERGHQVTVLTSRFDDNLPGREVLNGVEVIRPRVWLRISKGVIMPSMPLWAWRLVQQADVVQLHVPQLDAAPISLVARLLGKPVVLTYHCDLHLPKGFVHGLANRVSNLANHITARAAQVIVTNTRDYAEHSPFLKHYLDKVTAVPPPVELAPVSDWDREDFRARFGLKDGERIIGMAARLATEKGVEYLAAALPRVLEQHPTARILFVGPYQDVVGEEEYARRLAPLIERVREHWSFLGIVSPADMAAFFHESEVVVLPSINSTESFGIVQVEAMTCGTPVVASDLPGVRIPVQKTGMGLVTPIQDPDKLAEALIAILNNPTGYSGHPESLLRHSTPEAVAAEYEAIFESVLENAGQREPKTKPANPVKK